MAANLLCQHLTCQPSFSTFLLFNINVKFKTLQKGLVSISINPLFRNKQKINKTKAKKKKNKEGRKKEEKTYEEV